MTDSTSSNYDFLVSKADLASNILNEVVSREIADGEALLSVDRFAITANNITYGVAGDMIGYWQFFPADEPFGRIPVWGIGTVQESKAQGVEVGARYYGYFPMSSNLVVKPGKVGAHSFADQAEHRQALPPVYNQYALMTDENGYPAAHDNYQMVYRPLFTTSFVIDDFFFDNDFFNGKQVVLSSASSKTAFGTAFLLKDRDIKTIGLTSTNNKAFTEGLGLYDQVVTYDDVAAMDNAIPTIYIDMSGNRAVLENIHNHFADQLVYSCGVGITHWESRDGADPQSLPGAKPQMFFAPSQIQKRNADWGPAEFQSKLSESWLRFIDKVDSWVTIGETSAPASLENVYLTVLNGPAPDHAYVLVNDSSVTVSPQQ
jgi:hypothetical protein